MTKQILVRGDVGLEPQLFQFEEELSNWIDAAGLPTANLFTPVKDRAVLLRNAEDILNDLNSAIKEQSFYISKMIAAASAGLFDAALNYLWNEVIDQLRTRISNYDLQYFFDNAETNPDKRKRLETSDDLAKLTDDCLIRTCEKIGLLSPVGYHRLNNIRFMRNNASAAHPNTEKLTGRELATYLEECLETVIAQPEESFVGDIRILLARTRQGSLDDQAIKNAGLFFKNLPQERSNSLADGLLGQFVRPDRTEVQADNIRQLWPLVWPYVSEDAKSRYGVRHARCAAVGGSEEAIAIKELLDLVEGGAYLSETIRTAEISDAIEELLRVHDSWDNFYNEVSPARRLKGLTGRATIPNTVRPDYVAAVTTCFLGNGSGVSQGALPLYREMIQEFTPEEAGMALRSFMDEGISGVLSRSSGRDQWDELLDLLDRKFAGRRDTELLEAIDNFSGTPDKLSRDSKIRRLAERLPA